MARTVQCIKLGKEAEGLDFPPYPGELGKRIYESVSKQAWADWLKHQTMLVNENRLNLADQRARQYLARQMENHFFGTGADAAAGLRAAQPVARCRPMPEAVEWQPDGTPRSPRFQDIYRSCTGGLEQARHVFLHGCGLPGAWAGQPQWRILETGFGLGLNFLATWRAWKDDPQRPRMLHFASCEAWPVAAADLLRSAAPYPELQPLAEQLSEQWFGLLPGVHRLVFEDGHVLLTLYMRDVKEALRERGFHADSVFLDGFDPQRQSGDVGPAHAQGRGAPLPSRHRRGDLDGGRRGAARPRAMRLRRREGAGAAAQAALPEGRVRIRPGNPGAASRLPHVAAGHLRRRRRRTRRSGGGGQPGAPRLAGHRARRMGWRRPPAPRPCPWACWRRISRPTTTCCRA